METNIVEFGELIPGFTLRKKAYVQGGNDISSYEICLDNFPIFAFTEKPISYKKFLEDNTCATAWVFKSMINSKKFIFTPRIGFAIYNAIIESGWNVEKLNKEKRYNELDQAIYLFDLAGQLLEK